MRIEKSKRHRGDQIEILSTGHSFKQVPYPGLACFQRRLPRKKEKAIHIKPNSLGGSLCHLQSS